MVVSRNLHRRHLDPSQRALIAARLATTTHGGNRRGDQDATGQVDRRTAAAALNVSERSVARAALVLNEGTPELIAAVEAGDIPISTAANLVRPPRVPDTPLPLARTAHLDPDGRMTVPEYLEPPANRVPAARAATRPAARVPTPTPARAAPPPDDDDDEPENTMHLDERTSAYFYSDRSGVRITQTIIPEVRPVTVILSADDLQDLVDWIEDNDLLRGHEDAAADAPAPHPAAVEQTGARCTFCGHGAGDGRLLVDVGPNGDHFICDGCADDAAGQFFHDRNPRLEWVESASDFPDHPIARATARPTEETPDDNYYEITPTAFRRGAQAFHHYRIVYFDEGEIGEAASFEEAAAMAQQHADKLALGDPDVTIDRWAIWGD